MIFPSIKIKHEIKIGNLLESFESIYRFPVFPPSVRKRQRDKTIIIEKTELNFSCNMGKVVSQGGIHFFQGKLWSNNTIFCTKKVFFNLQEKNLSLKSNFSCYQILNLKKCVSSFKKPYFPPSIQLISRFTIFIIWKSTYFHSFINISFTKCYSFLSPLHRWRSNSFRCTLSKNKCLKLRGIL